MHAPVESVTSARPWWRAVPRLLPLVLVCLYGLLLLYRLDLPGRIIFDEVYYVNDARSFLALGGVEDSFAVHPPVGKWMIATTIELVGDNTVGWRLMGVLAGIGIAATTWRLARRLFATRWAANLALFLLVTDGLLFVQARTAMLDIYLALFVVLAAWLVVRDIDEPSTPAWRVSRWRWAAGVVLGLAIATKWSGLLALGAVGLITLATEASRWWRGRAGDTAGGATPGGEAAQGAMPNGDAAEADTAGVVGAEGDGSEADTTGDDTADDTTGSSNVNAGLLRRLGLGIAVPLVLVPIGVYLVTYIPWLVNYEHTTEGNDDCPGAADDPSIPCDVSAVGRLRGLYREHIDIARFHRDLESEHPYRAEAWSWPVMGRPISYYYETCPEDPAEAEEPCQVPAGMAAEVLALGNPALWWGFLALVPLVTSGMRRGERSSWVPGMFWMAQVVPWMVVSRPAFFFYVVPAVPFLALGVGAAVERLRVAPTDRVPWTGAASWALAVGLVVGLATRDLLAAMAGVGTGWVLGPLTADTWLTRRRRRGERARATDGAEAPAARSADVPWTAITVTALLVALAAALLIHFYPVWTGIPMDPADLRQRWWFRTWI